MWQLESQGSGEGKKLPHFRAPRKKERLIAGYSSRAFMVLNSVNPLTPNIKEQILLSCPHTFLFTSLILMTSEFE